MSVGYWGEGFSAEAFLAVHRHDSDEIVRRFCHTTNYAEQTILETFIVCKSLNHDGSCPHLLQL